MRIFLSTPLEDSRRLHPRHLARGINYRGGFTPVTVLPDRYPPSIRIKAGKGEGRERELLLAFQGSIGPRGARTSKTTCSPTSSTLSLSPIPTRHYRYHDLCKFCVNCWHYAPSYRLASPRLYNHRESWRDNSARDAIKLMRTSPERKVISG